MKTGSSAFIILTLKTIIIARKPINMTTLNRNVLIHGGVIPFLMDINTSNDDLSVFCGQK